MAKRKKKRVSARPKKLSSKSLVAKASAASGTADVEVTFQSGLGQLTAVLFRKGVLINMQSISTSDTIHFAEVQPQDSVAVNGVCTGSADITVNAPTNPTTPEHFTAGLIMSGYTIL